MKKPFAVLFVSAVLAVFGATVSGSALAHGGVRFGVIIGGPIFWPGPYYYPPVYYPPVVVVPAPPPVYIERQTAPPPVQSQSRDWFYCPDAKAYYPYVRECPGGWQRVPEQPPSH